MTTLWQGVEVTVQDGDPGTAQTITGVSKASNGVVTTSGTLPTNGQYVLFEVAGMTPLNFAVGKVSGATGSTFNCGIDTSLMPTFLSGTFRVVTVDQAFTGVRDISASGGDPVTEDTTTVHDLGDVEEIVSTSAVGYSFTENFGSTAPGFLELRAAAAVKAPRVVKFYFTNGKEQLFYATASIPNVATVSGRKAVTPVALRLKGPATVI